MLKVLIHFDIFLSALKQEDEKAKQTIKRCQEDYSIQAWSLANIYEKLIEENCSVDEVKKVLDSISLIPINSKLNNEALNSEEIFELGLLISAAKLFKLPYIVTRRFEYKSEGLHAIGCQEFKSLTYDYSSENINFLDLKLPLHSIFDQVDGWYSEIIQNTAFAGGNHVAAFEKEFAEYSGASYSVGLATGTDALLLAMKALGIGPGDEVITVPNTFIATTEAISQTGATGYR